MEKSLYANSYTVYEFSSKPGFYKDMKQIGLVLDIKQSYQRQIARGALAYFRESRRSKPIMLAGQVVHPVERVPLLEADGLLGQFYGEAGKPGSYWKGAFLSTANIPPMGKASCVFSDDEAVGRMGAAYLADLGYKHLAFAGNRQVQAFLERKKGFEAQCRERGRQISSSFDGVFTGLIMRRWQQTQNRILNALKALPQPVAVMTGDDLTGIAILQVALENGLRIPEDFALLGVNDDSLQLELLPVPMSSVRLNGEKVGFEAAQLLTAQLYGEASIPQRLSIPPLRVVERRSTDIVYCGDKAIERILQRMKARLDKPLSIPDLIGGSGMSRAKFDRRFQELLGTSPYQFILNLRFRKAEEMLLDTRYTVSEIAYACGFHKVHDFSAQFRKRKGMSPTEFRSEHFIS